MPHHTHVEYPDFDINCITELVAIVRTGQLATRRVEAAKHGWIVQGAIQKTVLGEWDGTHPHPTPPAPDVFTSQPPAKKLTDDEACDQLEAYASSLQSGTAQSLPPQMWLQLAMWLAEKVLPLIFRS